MPLYFEQHDSGPTRGRTPRVPDVGGGTQVAPPLVWQNNTWEIQSPQPPALRVFRRIAGMVPGDASDQNDEPTSAVWRLTGWEVQPFQPPALRYALRRAGHIVGDASDFNSASAAILIQFGRGWEIQAVQPPARRLTAAAFSSAIARGDDGVTGVFVAPWTMAPLAAVFPNIQNRAEGAMPSWIAGPPVGAVKSMPNISAPTLLKASPGTLFAVVVIAAGTGAGAAYDSTSASNIGQANQIAAIPTTQGAIVIDWPCQQGIVLVPGTGQVLAAKWW